MIRRKNKSVSFRLVDAYEIKLLAWAESDENGDYSKYVKRLIARDMEGNGRPPASPVSVEMPIVDAVQNDFSSFI